MRWLRVALIAVGVAFGILGVIFLIPELPRQKDVVTFGLWFLAPPILSDAVLMPAVAVLGWVSGRVLPTWLRLPVLVALVVSAAMIAVGLPFVGRPGLRPDNPSLLDRNYFAGLLIYLAIIWVVALGWAAVRWFQNRSETGHSAAETSGAAVSGSADSPAADAPATGSGPALA